MEKYLQSGAEFYVVDLGADTIELSKKAREQGRNVGEVYVPVEAFSEYKKFQKKWFKIIFEKEIETEKNPNDEDLIGLVSRADLKKLKLVDELFAYLEEQRKRIEDLFGAKKPEPPKLVFDLTATAPSKGLLGLDGKPIEKDEPVTKEKRPKRNALQKEEGDDYFEDLSVALVKAVHAAKQSGLDLVILKNWVEIL